MANSIKKIFLTGGNGMVGRNIRENKLIQQYEIFSPNREELDLLNKEKTFDYIKKIKPDLIIHAAGKVGGIQANINNPTDFLEINLEIGRNIILSAKELRVKRLLNIGSSCMYPKDINIPIKEENLLKGQIEPTNEGYALAKIVIAKLCTYIKKENPDLEYKTVIPCNLYGKYDKFDPKVSHLISAIIEKTHKAIINKENFIEIWGDGSAKREFLYAEDLAALIEKCISHFDSIPDIMNLGLGYDYSIKEYYEETAKVLDFKGEFKYNLEKPIGMKRKLLDITILKELGWEVKRSLNEGILKTYSFYKEGK
tara:strand:- start:8045 stop:8977 length:933 start_codon:yes stop_codon:yes gene_type:complete